MATDGASRAFVRLLRMDPDVSLLARAPDGLIAVFNLENGEQSWQSLLTQPLRAMPMIS